MKNFNNIFANILTNERKPLQSVIEYLYQIHPVHSILYYTILVLLVSRVDRQHVLYACYNSIIIIRRLKFNHCSSVNSTRGNN